MNLLQQRMQDDLRLRNYSRATERVYLYHVEQFTRHFDQSPRHLGTNDIRAYLLHLINERKCSWSWSRQAVAALRFLYGVTLDSQHLVPSIPYPRREIHLPIVLTPPEVERLLRAATHLKHQVLLMTIYSAGLRLSEALNLTHEDVDSERMVIHIRQGKGKRDRTVPLSSVLVHALRQYRRSHGTSRWIFPGQSLQRPIAKSTVQGMIGRARVRSGIVKRATARTLRHSYATHLLEAGTDIRVIQRLLGHATLASTEVYTHVSCQRLAEVRSPLDRLNVEVAPIQLTLKGL